MNAALVDAAMRAACDPGLFTKRGDDHREPLNAWQRRAMHIALRDALAEEG